MRIRLPREEYVEQAFFFRALLERLEDNLPLQELLESLRQEVLATTKLPYAIDFLLAELRHAGTFGTAMARLTHYFTEFQTFVISQAEDERGRFDMRVALAVLRYEADYRCENKVSPQGVFLYQFETLCHNRLSYDCGLKAMATDPAFDDAWRSWILTVRRQIGLVDLADLIYVRSQYYHGPIESRAYQPLFGDKEGKIALANRQKDPLLLFAALQRQLGYPKVPRPKIADDGPRMIELLMRRVERLETRTKLLEDDARGGFDLSQFYESHRPSSE